MTISIEKAREYYKKSLNIFQDESKILWVEIPDRKYLIIYSRNNIMVKDSKDRGRPGSLVFDKGQNLYPDSRWIVKHGFEINKAKEL